MDSLGMGIAPVGPTDEIKPHLPDRHSTQPPLAAARLLPPILFTLLGQLSGPSSHEAFR